MHLTAGNTSWWGWRKNAKSATNEGKIKAADGWLTQSAQTVPHFLNSTPVTMQPALRHERVRMTGQLANSNGSSITVSPHPEVGHQKRGVGDIVFPGCYVIKQEERWRSEGREEWMRLIMDQTSVLTWFWEFVLFLFVFFFLSFK